MHPVYSSWCFTTLAMHVLVLRSLIVKKVHPRTWPQHNHTLRAYVTTDHVQIICDSKYYCTHHTVGT